jgi:hypothetical protein
MTSRDLWRLPGLPEVDDTVSPQDLTTLKVYQNGVWVKRWGGRGGGNTEVGVGMIVLDRSTVYMCV